MTLGDPAILLCGADYDGEAVAPEQAAPTLASEMVAAVMVRDRTYLAFRNGGWSGGSTFAARSALTKGCR